MRREDGLEEHGVGIDHDGHVRHRLAEVGEPLNGVLRRGCLPQGQAYEDPFDAVVAACFAAGVIEPTASYSLLAEGVFMFYDSKSGDLLSLSGQGTAPGRATVDFYKSRGHECVPTGPGTDAP
ncbi:MAG: gamma-glutamyltransferase, partial [Deltaproteobacteria bacterium]|nr:gamma-glutamyltransferase [Deltaproteobacteria bacterium]